MRSESIVVDDDYYGSDTSLTAVANKSLDMSRSLTDKCNKMADLLSSDVNVKLKTCQQNIGDNFEMETLTDALVCYLFFCDGLFFALLSL